MLLRDDPGGSHDQGSRAIFLRTAPPLEPAQIAPRASKRSGCLLMRRD